MLMGEVWWPFILKSVIIYFVFLECAGGSLQGNTVGDDLLLFQIIPLFLYIQ